jgi:predicted transcriptional regulator YheO
MTEGGKKLKCSVIFLRDSEGILIGIVCVNIDITRAEVAKHLLDDLVRSDNAVLGTLSGSALLDGIGSPNRPNGKSDSPSDTADAHQEVFYRDLDDVWDHLLEEAKRASHVPLTHLTPQEIEHLIERLEQDGFFLVKGSINVLAKEIGKSSYTIYGYLRRIRARRDRVQPKDRIN